MKKIIFLVLTVLTFCCSSYAEDDHFTTGRGWNGFDISHKRAYILGLVDGIKLPIILDVTVEGVKKEDIERVSKAMSSMFPKATGEEYIEYIDKFYTDVANFNIPVLEAYKLMIIEYSGSSGTLDSNAKKIANKEVVQLSIEKLRSTYNH